MELKFDMGECTINSIKMVDVINYHLKTNKKSMWWEKIMINEIAANKLTKILKMHSSNVTLVMQKIKMVLVQMNWED